MSVLAILSIFFSLILHTKSVYLDERSNYLKPKLERNNVLNKGLWTKDKVEQSNYGDFIFRTDSRDVDNLVQNNFDAFGENFMDTVPVFSSYVERNKRSTIHKQGQRLRKGLKKCKDKADCKLDDDKSLFKSKFISKLRPASVFNDYPYEVAVLLANSSKREISTVNKTNNKINSTTIANESAENLQGIALENKNKTTTNRYNTTNLKIPKRRMTLTQAELETAKDDNIVDLNKTKHIDGNKIQRNVFDKEDRLWQSAPIQNMVIPIRDPSVKEKPVTEKGLIKVLALLTKTFRKVMKQHNDIQEIDSKLHSLNEDFMKNIAILDTKFQDFNTKYAHLLKINEELQQLNVRLMKQIEHFEHGETEMSKNLKEFENQQKQFLEQQRQFYAIQKFMLDQNEKINVKQGMIAKTQSEISHRQNHFARIIKKAKQYYLQTKSPGTSIMKHKNVIKTKDNLDKTTTSHPIAMDSVKINLFSIPKIEPLIINHDKILLREKYDHSIDDLVYKHYFNNTFIEQLIKSKFLSAVINEGKNTRNVKSKRNELSDKTLLLPINSIKDSQSGRNHRERRWIKYWNKPTKKYHTKDVPTEDKKKIIELKKEKNDPFLSMATNFCTQVGQNANPQMLSWCVEKSLRRSKSIDLKTTMKAIPPVGEPALPHRAKEVNSALDVTQLYPLETSTLSDSLHSSQTSHDAPRAPNEKAGVSEKAPLFFPDNDELESKLKQYDLKPDPEGTVYFDGSVHTSHIAVSESDALSDIMPGLDSDSRVDLDPLAIDLQARRRAYVRKLNENILKMNG